MTASMPLEKSKDTPVGDERPVRLAAVNPIDNVAQVSGPVPFALPLPASDKRFLRRRMLSTFATAARHFAPMLRASGRSAGVARPLRLTFQDLGATYVKFGQLLASSPGVFGDEIADEFRSCLDKGPAIDYTTVRRIVEIELGRPLEHAFAQFSEEPIAAASIAVVHKARLHDGRVVAVKVLRPDIERLVTADVELMEPLIELLANQLGIDALGNVLDAVSGFREQVAEELDLRNEARTMAHFLDMLEEVDLPMVAIPEPYPEFSGRRVLTMEFLDGVPIDDIAEAEAFGVDPKPLVEQVVRGWFMTSIRNGSFHGDVHAGNLLLCRDGRIGVLDWGIVGRLNAETHLFFRRVLEAALGDETAWDDVVAYVVGQIGPQARAMTGLDDAQFAMMVRNQIEPLFTKPFGEVSLAGLLMGPQEMIAETKGEGAEKPTKREILRRWKHNRDLRLQLSDPDSEGGRLDRGMFLLGKQFLYFERYGKMFMSDTSLLADAEFFRRVLADRSLDVRKRHWAYV